MDSIAKPSLPHTSNSLTPEQRTLLMRKAKKIEQLLGCPLHLVGDGIYDHKGNLVSRPCAMPTLAPSHHSRRSIDSLSSASTSSNDSQDPAARSSIFYPFKALNSLNRTTPDLTCPPDQSWVSKPQLSVSITQLSDLSDNTTRSEFLTSPHSNASSSPPLPINIPSFSIPTANSFRKAKFDRLRKKLGSGFPVELVFPSNDSPSSSTVDSTHSKLSLRRKSSLKKKKPTPTAQPTPTVSDPPKYSPISRQPPPPVRLVSTDVALPDLTTAAKKRLYLIPESPDEYIVESVQIAAPPHPNLKELPRLLPGILVSSSPHSTESGDLYCEISTLRKRPSGYRKPPPPVPNDLIS